MQYARTLTSAREHAAQGRLEDWVHAYLTSDGRNEAFSQGLKLCKRQYMGPLTLPLALLWPGAGDALSGGRAGL